MKLCPNRSAAEERSLKRGLLPSHGRIRRGPEGSSRKVDVRRSWDPRVETTTGTPCLEEMPITTDATTVHRKCRGLKYGRGNRRTLLHSTGFILSKVYKKEGQLDVIEAKPN